MALPLYSAAIRCRPTGIADVTQVAVLVVVSTGWASHPAIGIHSESTLKNAIVPLTPGISWPGWAGTTVAVNEGLALGRRLRDGRPDLEGRPRLSDRHRARLVAEGVVGVDRALAAGHVRPDRTTARHVDGAGGVGVRPIVVD